MQPVEKYVGPGSGSLPVDERATCGDGELSASCDGVGRNGIARSHGFTRHFEPLKIERGGEQRSIVDVDEMPT